MTFTVYIEKNVYKDLERIPKELLENFFGIVQGLQLNPWPSGVKKLVGSINKYRLRMGDYRIFYTIDHKNKHVIIIMVRHRKEVYRGLN